MPNPIISKIEVNGIEYDIEDTNTKHALNDFVAVSAYTTTLSTAQWANTTPSTYVYSNSNLKCGKDGNVPPIITCTNGESAYSTISSAVATSGAGIVFTAPSSPTIAIDLVIIDYN